MSGPPASQMDAMRGYLSGWLGDVPSNSRGQNCWALSGSPSYWYGTDLYLHRFPFPDHGLAYGDEACEGIIEAGDELDAIREALFFGYDHDECYLPDPPSPPPRSSPRFRVYHRRFRSGQSDSPSRADISSCWDRYFHFEPDDASDRVESCGLTKHVDSYLAQLFTALLNVRQLFVALQLKWWNSDLVGFAMEKSPDMMPQWVRCLSVRVVRKLMAALEAARRLFIKISHRVPCTIFNDSLTGRAISKYIGQWPRPAPYDMYWTPRKGHWDVERVRQRLRVRWALGRPWRIHRSEIFPEPSPEEELVMAGMRDDLGNQRLDQLPLTGSGDDRLPFHGRRSEYIQSQVAAMVYGRTSEEEEQGMGQVKRPPFSLVLHHVKHPRKLKSTVRTSEVPQVSDVVSCKMMTRAGWQLVRGPRKADDGNWNHQRWTCEQALKPKQVNDEGCRVQ